MRLFLGLFFCLLLPITVYSSPITRGMRQDDPRLEKHINVVGYRFYTGELLEQLTSQSGVSLIAETKGGASDDRLSVVLLDLPLAEAMNAIRSLFSYQGAIYLWQREVTHTPDGKTIYQYKLVRPKTASVFGNTVNQQIQEDFEQETLDLVAQYKTSVPEEPETAATDEDKIKARDKSAVAILASVFSEQQIMQVLRGKSAYLPKDNFNDAIYRFSAIEKSMIPNLPNIQ